MHDRQDESPDPIFYAQPRFVVHIDDAAIEAVRTLYARLVKPGANILDLMSSWRSHLPAGMTATGLGMSATEMRDNPQLRASLVADLNATPVLPLRDGCFDAVVCCVSVQYLVRPIDVFRDVTRVLRPGGRVIVTFSNRCFPTKAVAAWLRTDDSGHVALVERYLRDAGFTDVLAIDASRPYGDPLFAVCGSV